MASSVRIRFYGELGDLLPVERRAHDFEQPFALGTTVKDLIESLGVPHTEVDLILVDGESVDFSYQLSDGERVGVYPVFESFDISGLTLVRPKPLRDPRFVCDVHLGKLASYLRLAGFDTLYESDLGDGEIVDLALSDRRTVLTRDRGLLKRSAVTHGYLVRDNNPRRQIREVVERFDLAGLFRPFSRCSVCNGVIESVPKEEVLAQLPAHTAQTQTEFWRCSVCRRVYWKGSHYEALLLLLSSIQSGGPDQDLGGGRL